MNAVPGLVHELLPDLAPGDAAALDAQERERRSALAVQVAVREAHYLAHAGVGDAIASGLDAVDVPPQIRAWWGTWREHGPRGGLILAGPVGTGKSTLAARSVRAAYRAGRWDDPDAPTEWEPYSARFLRMTELRRMVFGGAAAERELRLLEAVALLVVEDVRRMPEGAWPVVDELFGLIDARWSAGRATIVTTNLHPNAELDGVAFSDSFESLYEPVYSRLVQGGPGVVRVVSRDRRRSA